MKLILDGGKIRHANKHGSVDRQRGHLHLTIGETVKRYNALADRCEALERGMAEIDRLTRDVKCHPDARNWIAAIRATANALLANGGAA